MMETRIRYRVPVLAQELPSARFVVTVRQAFPVCKILADLREHVDHWTDGDFAAFEELVNAVNAHIAALDEEAV